MAKKFKDLRDGISPKRRAMQLAQAQIAEELDIKQCSVSKLERRTDLRYKEHCWPYWKKLCLPFRRGTFL